MPEPQLFFLSSYNSTLLSCPLLASHYLIISHLDFSSSSHSDTSSFSQPINYFPYLDFQDQLCHWWAWQNWWDKEQVKNGETELVRQNGESWWEGGEETTLVKTDETEIAKQTGVTELLRQNGWEKTGEPELLRQNKTGDIELVRQNFETKPVRQIGLDRTCETELVRQN